MSLFLVGNVIVLQLQWLDDLKQAEISTNVQTVYAILIIVIMSKIESPKVNCLGLSTF
jgi:hypothetical protein